MIKERWVSRFDSASQTADFVRITAGPDTGRIGVVVNMLETYEVDEAGEYMPNSLQNYRKVTTTQGTAVYPYSWVETLPGGPVGLIQMIGTLESKLDLIMTALKIELPV